MPTLREEPALGYLCLADLHGKKNNPRYRIDDYKQSFLEKLEWSVEYANDRYLRMLIAGDLFESIREGIEMLNMVLSVFNKALFTPIAVYGQHDLQFHTKNMLELPIYNLALAGALLIVGKEPIIDGEYSIYGAGFEEEIPVPDTPHSILLIHKCITPGEPPFFLPDAISSEKFINEHDSYQFIVSGDYHEGFIEQSNKTILVNCGPMMRNSKALKDYSPCTWVIQDGGVERIDIPVKPAIEVFDVEAIEFDTTHGMTLDLSRMKELMGTEYVVKDFKDVVWAGYNSIKNQEGCFVKEESIKRALQGEQIWG